MEKGVIVRPLPQLVPRGSLLELPTLRPSILGVWPSLESLEEVGKSGEGEDKPRSKGRVRRKKSKDGKGKKKREKGEIYRKGKRFQCKGALPVPLQAGSPKDKKIWHAGQSCINRTTGKHIHGCKGVVWVHMLRPKGGDFQIWAHGQCASAFTSPNTLTLNVLIQGP